MAAVTGKRKREVGDVKQARFQKTAKGPKSNGVPKSTTAASLDVETPAALPNGTSATTPGDQVSIQIVTGSYERVLHGICATVPYTLLKDPSERNGSAEAAEADPDTAVTSTNTFLFAPHTSSIRCLAISPPSEGSNKRTLATGSSDERINLYSLATAPPSKPHAALTTAENPSNKSLGSLTHHSRPLTRLLFPPNSRSKLFSSAEDNTIAITRSRDWTVLSSLHAPIPQPTGRPSGDTAAPGEVPAGVNDFAVHPSGKLMLSVSRGERCLRLWNLMTGKKAGVLNFSREVLARAGEGKHSSGEGRRVVWDEEGSLFVVGFERGAVVFGVDSKPQAVVMPESRTKIHEMRFLPSRDGEGGRSVLAASTEDGRVLFFSISIPDADVEVEIPASDLPTCPCIAQLGGAAASLSGRIKDFAILQLPSLLHTDLVIVTGSSDGAVRIWALSSTLRQHDAQPNGDAAGKGTVRQVGNLLGMVETGNRITCLGAFIMDGSAQVKAVEAELELDAGEDEDEDEDESENNPSEE